jgi:uncharacterized protein YcbX
MQIEELWIYPLKSCRGIALTEAEVTPKGLAGDREMMIVDTAGKFLTQRDYPQMATLSVQLKGEEVILSVAESKLDSISLKPGLNGQKRPVQVWRDRGIAIDQGDAVAQWLQAALNLSDPVRLVRQTPEHPRFVDPHYAPTGKETVSFADGYPILIANTASLDDLNRRLEATYQNAAQNVPMSRFRPNIVIETHIPFGESEWKQLQIGTIKLALVKPCSRCIVTTTDQHTGIQNRQREPLKTLSTFRQVPQQGILFGENAIPLSLGKIHVGDNAIAV